MSADDEKFLELMEERNRVPYSPVPDDVDRLIAMVRERDALLEPRRQSFREFWNGKRVHQPTDYDRHMQTYLCAMGNQIDRISQLEAALEFYADGFAIMDHIDGTYTIHETWYAKAREALAKVGKE